MEISKSQIARLVLGYLKSENCKNAFHEFLLKSEYLKSLAVFVKNGKYFATRVGGLTLEEILAEYSDISLIIQGRLEQTDYYEKEHKMKLSNQLLYILDHNSRSSSPTLPKDLNATPSESLPGNSSNTSHNSSVKSSVESGECTHSEIENTSNISNTSQRDGKRNGMADLDTKLKTIEEKAEQCPVFDSILEEIIGDKNITSTEGSTSRLFLDKSRSSNSNIQAVNMPKSNSIENSNNISTNINTSDSCTKNSELIVVDSYGNKPMTTASQQGQFILTNTPAGLLMVPSVMGGQNYILVNSGQAATSTPVGNILTETDIMKMPTVILDDPPRPTLMTVPQTQMAAHQMQASTHQHPVMTQSQIIITSLPQVATSVATQNVKAPMTSSSNCHMSTSLPQTVPSTCGVRRVKTIAPKTDKITLATSDGDYYKVFDEKGQHQSSPKVSEAETSKKSPKDRPVLRRRLSRQSKSKITSFQQDSSPEGSEKTPSKSIAVDSPQKKEPKKSAKSLFKDNQNDSKKNVWDADLRELLIPNKAKKSLDTSDDKMDSSDDRLDTTDNKLDVTCDDEELKKGALMIEAAFITPIKTPRARHDEEASNKEENIAPAEAVTSSEEKTEERFKTPEDTEVVIETEETEVYLRNCNGPPRFKKKCNQTDNTADIFEVEVVEQSAIPEGPTKEPVVVNSEPGTSKVRKDIILETPVKEAVPKTPGKFEITPFTKVIEEQLLGMDLLSLSTPKFGITPNLPITPNLDLNTPDHHSNRPTDYSTSSSYYQPSDTEQNKSLETMMEEYRREERKNLERMKIEENNKNDKEIPVVSEMKRMFNENVIGKKNLSMMKQQDPSCLGDSSISSNSSSNSNSDSSSESDSDSDFTSSISKKSISSPKEPYSFRKRKSPVTDSANEIRNKKPVPSPKSDKKVISIQQEIKEKKERTIRAIKKDTKESSTTVQKQIQPRKKNGKFARIIKTKTPPVKINKEIIEKCEVENEITDDDFALHLSTDEDSVNKINNETVISKNKDENASKTTNNVEEPATEEAKQLIQGLSERGIYLVPKVSPKKVDQFSDCKKTGSDDENALENLEVSSEDNSSEDEGARDLSSLQNPEDVTFDIKCYGEEEQLNFVYDSSKRRKKKVYDLEVLKRDIQADVFIESLDKEIVRIIKCAPTESIIELPPIKAPVKRRRSVKPESKPAQPKDKKQGKVTNPKSENEPKIAEINVENKDKCGVSKKKSPELKKSPQKKSESTETKNQKKIETTDTKGQKKISAKRSKSVDNAPKTIDNSNGIEKIVETVPFEAVNERTVIERLERDDEDKLPSIGSGDDELMNFAVLGNLMDEAKEASSKGGDKRKFSSDGESSQPEKKCKIENEKSQALLKKVNVDLFLNKVHGDAKPS